jgi:hypothetical protein
MVIWLTDSDSDVMKTGSSMISASVIKGFLWSDEEV